MGKENVSEREENYYGIVIAVHNSGGGFRGYYGANNFREYQTDLKNCNNRNYDNVVGIWIKGGLNKDNLEAKVIDLIECDLKDVDFEGKNGGKDE